MVRVTDMTHGRPIRLILLFSLPLMLGSVFQQLYTIVDTIIIGRGVGMQALASIGAADWINWLVLWRYGIGPPTWSHLGRWKFGSFQCRKRSRAKLY